MIRSYARLIPAGALVVLAALATAPSYALTLLSPTEDQTVREKVKITVPESALPAGFTPAGKDAPPPGSRPFVALTVDSDGMERLIAAFSPDSGVYGNGRASFYWDSKSPYHDQAEPKVDKFFKDGRYVLKVQVYDSLGKLVDSANVNVDLKNKVARRNPAPAIALRNKLSYGQVDTYKAHADVQVYQVVNGIGLPILGGMGMTSDFKIIQSVEDVRPGGEYMIRYRMDPDGYIRSFGRKVQMYQDDQPKPQLYRLADKCGNVIERNMFSKQGLFTIMDVLPILPSRSVKEGDSWPTTFDLKIEGITNLIPLTGSSNLDSFEWQNGHECAKIISTLNGNSTISMNGGKIRGSSNNVTVQAITFFDYRNGRMLKRQVSLEFPVVIAPDAGDVGDNGPDGGPSGPTGAAMTNPITSNYGSPAYDEDAGSPSSGTPSPYMPGMKPASKEAEGTKRGTVQIDLVVGLEK